MKDEQIHHFLPGTKVIRVDNTITPAPLETPRSSRGSSNAMHSNREVQVVKPTMSFCDRIKSICSAICNCFKSIFCCCIRKASPEKKNLISTQKEKIAGSGSGSGSGSESTSTNISTPDGTTAAQTNPVPITSEYPNGYWIPLDSNNDHQDSDSDSEEVTGGHVFEVRASIHAGGSAEPDIHQLLSPEDFQQYVSISKISVKEYYDPNIDQLEQHILEKLNELPANPTKEDWTLFTDTIKSFCSNMLGIQMTGVGRWFLNYFWPPEPPNMNLLTRVAQTLLTFTGNPRVEERCNQWAANRIEEDLRLLRNVDDSLYKVVEELGIQNQYTSLVKAAKPIVLDIRDGQDRSESYSTDDIKTLEKDVMKMVEHEFSEYMESCEKLPNKGMEPYKKFNLPSIFIGVGKDIARMPYSFLDNDGIERAPPNNKTWRELSFEEKQAFAVSEISRLANGDERTMQHICRYANQNPTIGVQNGIALGLLMPYFGEGTLISDSTGCSIQLMKEQDSDKIIITYKIKHEPVIIWNNLFGMALFIKDFRDKDKWDNLSKMELTFSVALDPKDHSSVTCRGLQGELFLP